MNNLEPNPQQGMPLSLKVIAVLFILGGISSAIEVLVSLMNSQININFGVLGIFIGFGLFKLSQGWRTCALVYTWLVLILLPIIGVHFLSHSGPLVLTLFGQKLRYAPKEFGVAMVAILFLYTLWQYRVLTRNDVRRLFIDQISEQGGALQPPTRPERELD